MNFNIFKTIKVNSLRKKKEKLLNESNLYSAMNRKKSDQLYKEAMDVEDKILKLLEK
jgi:hypothetical protein